MKNFSVFVIAACRRAVLPAIVWTAFVLPFGAMADDLQAVVTAVRPMPATFFGFNGNFGNLEAPWNDAELVAATRRTGAATLRYPGGTVANFWDWNKGGVRSDLSVHDVGASRFVLDFARRPGGYSIENLARGVRATGITPIFVVNMTDYTPQQQIAFLKNAQTEGVPVRYVELGNEFYFGKGAHPHVFRRYPSVAAYAQAAQDWSSRIKAAFPGVKVAIVGAGDLGHLRTSARRKGWDERLSKDISSPDAVTYHIYVDPLSALDPQSLALEALRRNPNDPENRCAVYTELTGPQGMRRLMAQADPAWERKTRAYDSEWAAPIWVTEFAVWDKTGVMSGTWAQGLATGRLIDAFLRDKRVEIVNLHNLFAQVAFTAVWRYRNEIESPCSGDRLSGTKHAFTATGTLFAAFANAAAGADSAFRISGKSAAGGAGDPVYGWGFSHDKKPPRIVLVNDGARAVRFSLGAILPAESYAVKTLSAKPGDYILSENSWQRSEAIGANVLTLPPFSISTLDDNDGNQ
ncbi:hypothetical protein G3580_03435 [Nitrogeniibacter mangrovi]|uniref:Alpha-L-arabinofuranosidase n=1 Tax=Nitrogeniibacter mangrovi TaxID=2016596 RepID=A0A6C1B1A1_9RHOO|nr:hypothetical protein [Nitrogeniibacter mangrovi]QID16769.1 hypothetical protein G3580_03435 [Nitrogeniibacter mangrovi]